MEDDEVLELERRIWEREVRFFSNAGKEKRERWVVREFLTRIGVSFTKREVVSCDVHSKIDVEFREACFQVKEIVTPGTRRGDEVKALWKQAQTATRPEEVVGLSIGYDVPPPAQAYNLVVDEAKNHAQSGQYEPGALDLLVYVTRTFTAPIRPEEMNAEQLAAIGWRSLSYLIGDEALVLYAQDKAPAFLRAHYRGS